MINSKNKVFKTAFGSQAPAWEPKAEAPASRDWKLELPGLHSQAGAWERVQHFRDQ